MALFKETSEVQAFIPVIGETAIESMLPFINQAERDYIIPYISKAQYDALNDAYNASPSTLTAEQTALLEKVQATLSQYFFYLWIPSAQLHIGDNGIRIATTDTLKTAFQWQIDELRRSVLKAAGSAMDDLLEFMEANKADYPLWTASTSYTEFKDCFITTTTKFTELYSPLGNSRLNFLMLRSSMKKAQEFSIQSLIGPSYYDELKIEHLNGYVTAENALVITLIQKALAPLTMLRAITELSLTIDERGMLTFKQISAMETLNQKASDAVIFKLEKAADEDSKAYMQMLKDFLQTNIADYPTYAASTSYNSETTNTTFENKSDNNFYFAG